MKDDRNRLHKIKQEHILEDNGRYIAKYIDENEKNKIDINYNGEFNSSDTIYVTFETNNIILHLEQSTVDLFQDGKLEWYLNTLEEAVINTQKLLGITLENKINIKTIENLDCVALITDEIKYDRNWFMMFIDFDYNNERLSQDLYYISSAVKINDYTFGRVLLPYAIEYFIQSYLIEKGNTNARGNGETIVYKGSEIINYYEKKYRETVAIGIYSIEGFTYSLLKIKNKIGWIPFEKAFNDLADFLKTSYESWTNREKDIINFILDKVAEYSQKNIYNMFTQEELEVYENYYAGELGGKYENCLSGDGTEDNPYQIESTNQFRLIENNMNAYYILMCDLDFENQEFIPIGLEINEPFKGNLNGDNFIIKNINISSDSSLIGLFAKIEDSEIYNLTIKYVTINSDNNNSIIGTLSADATNSNLDSISIINTKISSESEKNWWTYWHKLKCTN